MAFRAYTICKQRQPGLALKTLCSIHNIQFASHSKRHLSTKTNLTSRPFQLVVFQPGHKLEQPIRKYATICRNRGLISHPSSRLYSSIPDGGKELAAAKREENASKEASTAQDLFEAPTAILHSWQPRQDISNDTRFADINKKHLGATVTVHGFLTKVHIISQHLVFADLLDDGVKLQIVHQGAKGDSSGVFEILKSAALHTPIRATGIVQVKAQRSSSDRQEYELQISSISLLNAGPMTIITKQTVFGLSDRHLQIRTDTNLLKALKLRAKVASICRRQLEDEQFLEVETPLLFKSTPEGAREFLVPTRQQGMMYALPQSPQQYKQILMASGIPRYYQIAKCFRDEDLRADRQPEFTQLDLEMSYSTGHDVMDVVERLLRRIWSQVLDVEINQIPVITYHQAIAKYGSDKPDTRIPWEITDLTCILAAPSEHDIIYEGFGIPKMSLTNKAFLDLYNEVLRYHQDPSTLDREQFFAVLQHKKKYHLEYVQKFLPHLKETELSVPEILQKLEEALGTETSNLYILTKRPKEFSPGGSTQIGRLRKKFHKIMVDKGLIPAPTGFSFLWVTNFPLFTPSTDPSEPGQGGETGYKSTHHPFTAPIPAHEELFNEKPFEVLGWHYDIVVNGVELGGGSTRIHRAEIQRKVLEDILQLPKERLETFEHFLSILDSGCPPHAGLALGFDRLVAVLHGTESVRDVIAFPKTASGSDPMVKSPSKVSERALRNYGLASLTEGAEEVDVKEVKISNAA